MQISRLFEIVYTLLGKKTATAKELAVRFGVSTRTIYRDVDMLSGAGIPIYMSQGKGGGISLLDNYTLHKTMLSEGEQNEVLTALSALRSVNHTESQDALSKLSAIFGKSSQNWIKVNFSHSRGFDMKFETIKKAIFEKRVLSFDYHSREQEKTSRLTEPLQLRFNANAWYLYAYCRLRQDMRIFKISRMENVKITETGYERVYDEKGDPATDFDMDSFVKLVIRMDRSQAYRILDEFTDTEAEVSNDGSFIITLYYPEDEWVYGYILSFGHYAEVLEPTHIREIIAERLKKTLVTYGIETLIKNK
jgi:predicted DNA-binding transcriptional regulator YafY